jgi:preprotein translocase subunit SecA
MKVGCVIGETKPPFRAEGYAKPIVYSTAKDVLADFLRDRLAAGDAGNSVLRLARALAANNVTAGARTLPPLDAVIVDEADHVLIDEAVTPLIISQKVENATLADAVKVADRLVADFVEGSDFVVDRRHREIRVLESGRARIAASKNRFPEGWASASRRAELVDTALQARAFFLRDHHYVVVDDKVVIVDESTGRLMPDRQWQQGLHQAVEVKEGLEPGHPTVIAARMSFQRFFRLYHKLAGLTGTAWEARYELHEIYGLKVLCIPTHRPCLRVQEPDEIVAAEGKWLAICNHIESVHRTQRPVLAGTRTVADSERLRQMLESRGYAVEVLNAINHEREAEIVANAGALGRIMIATNMAGRGTDIVLAAGVSEIGGLHVVAAERHASLRIDRQMFGRAGRQGDPGSARAFASLDDDVVVRHAPGWLRECVVRAGHIVPGLSRPLSVWLIRYSQQIAGRRDASRRRQLLEADYRLEESLGTPPEVS